MNKLKVSIKSAENRPGNHKYENEVNGDNYKEIALILMDLSNYNIPIEKAILEFNKMRKTDWDAVIGI